MKLVVSDKKLRNCLKTDRTKDGEAWKLKHKIISFIEQLTLKLNLPKSCWATACILFHRYVLNHEIISLNSFIVGSACLFLACKIDENKIKIETLVEAHFFLCNQQSSKNNKKEGIEKCTKIHTINLILDMEFEIIASNDFEVDIELPFEILQDSKM